MGESHYKILFAFCDTSGFMFIPELYYAHDQRCSPFYFLGNSWVFESIEGGKNT